jgi:hypothetical protein
MASRFSREYLFVEFADVLGNRGYDAVGDRQHFHGVLHRF